MHRSVPTTLAIVALVVLAIGCQAPAVPDVSITDVTITGPREHTVHAGSSLNLTAVVTTTGGASDAVVWASDDEAVATVTSTGTVSAHALGHASISAASAIDPTKRDAVEVGVTAAPAVLGVTLDPPGDHALLIGETMTFTATVDTEGGASADLAWSGSNPSVATIEDGLVTAHATGSTTIAATSVADPTKSAEATITVTAQPAVLAVGLSPSADQALHVGETLQLNATVTATGGLQTTVTWSSDAPTVATVDAGLVTAIDVGTALITATSTEDPTRYASLDVSVTTPPAVTGIVIDGPSERTVQPDDSVELTATVTVTGGLTTNVAWSATCGSISGSGTTITFIAPSAPMTCTVTASSVANPAVAASVVFSIEAPATGELLWLRELGGLSSEETGLHVRVDAAGNTLFAGTTDGPWLRTLGGERDMFAIELDPLSTSRWLSQFGSEGNDRPLALAFTSDGSRLIAGTTGTDLYVRAISEIGSFQWARSFGNAPLAVSVSAMEFTSDGDLLIAGSNETGLGAIDPGGENAFVARFDLEGNLVWLSRFGAGVDLYTNVSAIHVDDFDNIYLTGERERGQGFLTRFDAAGAQQWWEPLTFDFEYYYASGANLSSDASGRVFMVGTWDPPSVFASQRGFLAVYDPDGTRAWTTIVGPAEGTSVTAVAVDADGYPVVAGATRGQFGEATGGPGQQAVFVAKYDPDGGFVWVRGPVPGRDASAADLASGPNGTTTLVGAVEGQVLVARLGP